MRHALQETSVAAKSQDWHMLDSINVQRVSKFASATRPCATTWELERASETAHHLPTNQLPQGADGAGPGVENRGGKQTTQHVLHAFTMFVQSLL